MRSAPRAHRQQRGFTLVEALVALVVLSIGLLGVAGLQLASLRSNTSSSYRSQATFLAYDIADRMRANRQAAIAGGYLTGFGDPVPESATTVAEADLLDWKGRVNAGAVLPADADAEIAWEDEPNHVVAIRIRWNDSHGDAQLAQAAVGHDTNLVTFEMRTRI